MGHGFGTAVLGLASAFCVLTTVSSLAAPRQFAARLGLCIANAGGTNEVRSQYAGFFLAVALVCIAALVGALARQEALIVLATVFGGLLAGRLCSLGLDRGVAGYSPTIRALYAIDAAGFAAALGAIAAGG